MHQFIACFGLSCLLNILPPVSHAHCLPSPPFFSEQALFIFITTTPGFLFVRFLPFDYRKIRQKLSFSIFIEFLRWQKLSFWENPIEFWKIPLSFGKIPLSFFFKLGVCYSNLGQNLKFVSPLGSPVLLQNVRVPHLIFIFIPCYEKSDFGFIKKVGKN